MIKRIKYSISSSSSSVTGRFSRGVAWSIIGVGFSQVIGLAAVIISARILGKNQFGEFSIIQSTIGIYGVFAGMWLGIGATKFVAEFKTTFPERAGRIIGLSFIIAIVSSIAVSIIIMGLAPYLAKHVLNAPHLSTELSVVAGIIVLNVLDGVQVGVLSGFEAFKALARTSIIRSIIAFPITVISIWLWGLSGAILSLAVIGTLNLWINHIALRHECNKYGVTISYKGTNSELRTFLNYSTPALFGSLLGAPVFWVANALLVNQPNGYAEMGIYAIANQWKTAVMFLPRRFISVALPMMSEDYKKTNSLYNDVFALTHDLSILIVIPLITFLVFTSHWIIKLYGEDFSDARVVLIGALFATGISALGSGVGPAIQASGRMWFGLFTNVVWSCIFLLFVWLFVHYLGAKALVFGMALSYAVMVLYSIVGMRKKLPKGVTERTMGSIFLLCAITVTAISLDNFYLNVMTVPATLTAVVITFYLFISQSMCDRIIKLVGRCVNGKI